VEEEQIFTRRQKFTIAGFEFVVRVQVRAISAPSPKLMDRG
jgi:hypothetical protein